MFVSTCACIISSNKYPTIQLLLYYHTTIQPAKKIQPPFSDNLCRLYTYCRHDNELIPLVLDWMQVQYSTVQYSYRRIGLDWIVLCCARLPPPHYFFSSISDQCYLYHKLTVLEEHPAHVLYIPYRPKPNSDQLNTPNLAQAII